MVLQNRMLHIVTMDSHSLKYMFPYSFDGIIILSIGIKCIEKLLGDKLYIGGVSVGLSIVFLVMLTVSSLAA